MTFYGFHGVNPAEKELGQRFIVDLDIFTDLAKAGRTDDLAGHSLARRVERRAVPHPAVLLELRGVPSLHPHGMGT